LFDLGISVCRNCFVEIKVLQSKIRLLKLPAIRMNRLIMKLVSQVLLKLWNLTPWQKVV
jgi:hypothetical protein